MIVYQGKGYLVYLIPIFVFIICLFLNDKTNWIYIWSLVSALLELILAYISYREHKGNPYKYLDKLTGEEVFIEHKNTLYSIKVEYWGVFIAVVLLFNIIPK